MKSTWISCTLDNLRGGSGDLTVGVCFSNFPGF
jgi:hypothetical protein